MLELLLVGCSSVVVLLHGASLFLRALFAPRVTPCNTYTHGLYTKGPTCKIMGKNAYKATAEGEKTSKKNTETEHGQREGSDSSSSVPRSSSDYPCDCSRRRSDLVGGHGCDIQRARCWRCGTALGCAAAPHVVPGGGRPQPQRGASGHRRRPPARVHLPRLVLPLLRMRSCARRTLGASPSPDMPLSLSARPRSSDVPSRRNKI